MVNFSYTRQKEPLGLGHAVLAARELVGDEPFAVLLGDVIIPGPHPATRQLVEVYEQTGIGTIAVEEVPREKTSLYGIVDCAPEKRGSWGGKTAARQGPGGKAVAERRAFQPGRHRPLRSCRRRSSTSSERPSPGRGGEIQLTDALLALRQ